MVQKFSVATFLAATEKHPTIPNCFTLIENLFAT